MKYRNESENSSLRCSTEGELLWGSMSIFCVHPSTPPPTMEPNKGRQPAGHLTCVRHGTYLRGEPVLETAELITSRLTGAGSLLPPVYGEAWAKGHATGTPDSTFPRYGSPHTANMRVRLKNQS
ncbi:hypothetical protein TNCV_670521 [Trichonephila clavipes]|nr:hypothetical protein TNCV_670521 [Trichonephila clavipes]